MSGAASDTPVVLCYEPPPALIEHMCSPMLPWVTVVAGGTNDVRATLPQRGLRFAWRVFPLDGSVEDIVAHMRDASIVVNCARDVDPSRLVAACLSLRVHYVDVDDVHAERVFEAVSAFDSIPASLVVPGLGVMGALDCLASELRATLTPQQLLDTAPKLMLAQSHLTAQQQRVRRRPPRGFDGFVVRRGQKLTAEYGGIRWCDAPLTASHEPRTLWLNPFCSATLLAMLDTGFPTVESFVDPETEPLTRWAALVRLVSRPPPEPLTLFAMLHGQQRGARLTLRCTAEEYAAHFAWAMVYRLMTAPLPPLVGFATPAQCFGPTFAWTGDGLAAHCTHELADLGAEASQRKGPFPWLVVVLAVAALWFLRVLLAL